MNIIRLTERQTNWLESIQLLLPQLTDSKIDFDLAAFKQVIQSPNTYLLAAVEAKQLHGILTLTLYRIPSGLQAHIDDVVVDTNVRGRGIGRRLMEEALTICKQNQVDQVHLSSHPRRIAANRLYRKLGFEQRETHVYALDLRKTQQAPQE